MTDRERTENIKRSLKDAGLKALICALPKNVLLLTGYWPVVGTSLAIAVEDGQVRLLVPQDEEDLAEQSWASEIETFQPHSLHDLITPSRAILEPLWKIAAGFTQSDVRIGIEEGETSEPASYAATHLYHGSLARILGNMLPAGSLVAADELLRTMRTMKTRREIARIRVACEIAGHAFELGASLMHHGMTELEAAQLFEAPLSTGQIRHPSIQRTGGFAWAMSGSNSAKAHGAYARSRLKRIDYGDLVLVHCNSYADGYWTDITRTFCIGRPKGRAGEMYAAVFAAREAALNAIAPGVAAAEVDHAARSVLDAWGFGANFKHSTGHGVGFGAISPNAMPRLHPKSPDVLQVGMVFNLEPAIYVEGYGGIRHCDMVAIGDSGANVLTPFHSRMDDLIVGGAQAAHG